MQKTIEIPFRDVKVGQEFALTGVEQPWGGFKINETNVPVQRGSGWEIELVANAVLLFDRMGNRSAEAGTLLPMRREDTVHVFAEDGSGNQAAGSTVIGALCEERTGGTEKTAPQITPQPPQRRRLPDTRTAMTHKFEVAGHEGYITVGLFEDGRPGELFIVMAKEGATLGGLMDGVGTLTSMALQYGVPVEVLVKKFAHVRFEPSGYTKNPEIQITSSVLDYIFRWLGMQFIPSMKKSQPSAQEPLLPGLSATNAS